MTALLFLLPVTAHAADKAVMLSDDEQNALVQILDAATKAQGISIAPNAVYFLNKIRSAPTVVPHVDAPAPKPRDPEEPPE